MTDEEAAQFVLNYLKKCRLKSGDSIPMEFLMRHGYDLNIPMVRMDYGVLCATAFGWITVDLDHQITLTTEGMTTMLGVIDNNPA